MHFERMRTEGKRGGGFIGVRLHLTRLIPKRNLRKGVLPNNPRSLPSRIAVSIACYSVPVVASLHWLNQNLNHADIVGEIWFACA